MDDKGLLAMSGSPGPEEGKEAGSVAYVFSPTSQLQQVWPPLELATCRWQPWAVRLCQPAGGRVGYDP